MSSKLHNTELKPHAILDKVSRTNKANKISHFLSLSDEKKYKAILEIGTGSGYIANYFSEHYNWSDGVYAVDVSDQRIETEGYEFSRVNNTILPYNSSMFDYIVSNHVIEHVGGRDEQINHLNEIHRCLSDDGVLYLAVPNRWRLVEPHYKLPFLSWFPESIASFYMRLFKRGDYYDCKPLTNRDLKQLLDNSGFEYYEATIDAISVVSQLEGGHLTKLVGKLPKFIWKPFSIIMPTLIYLCRKP